MYIKIGLGEGSLFKHFHKYIGILLIVCLMLFGVKGEEKSVFNETHLNDYVIVIDAGHGGDDGGAIGIKTLTREKDINLSIALKLARLLESSGATVVLTRKDEKALSEGKFNKMEDMTERANIIENARPYIVISIHCNSFPQSTTVKGAQTFYYPGSETGQRLAESIQESLRKYVDGNNNRKVKCEDFYMLRHGNSTNIMVECGFLSCPEEEKLLLDDEHQNKLAYAIFDGTVRYISEITKPSNI